MVGSEQAYAAWLDDLVYVSWEDTNLSAEFRRCFYYSPRSMEAFSRDIKERHLPILSKPNETIDSIKDVVAEFVSLRRDAYIQCLLRREARVQQNLLVLLCCFSSHEIRDEFGIKFDIISHCAVPRCKTGFSAGTNDKSSGPPPVVCPTSPPDCRVQSFRPARRISVARGRHCNTGQHGGPDIQAATPHRPTQMLTSG